MKILVGKDWCLEKIAADPDIEVAGGSEADEDAPCGETLYTAVKAVAPDGAEIPLDDDP